MTTAQVDALIVGAGFSGLTCALNLARAGKRVICVEARPRLGGRAFTHTFNDSTGLTNTERTIKEGESGRTYSVDFGCSYIHGYNEGNPVKDLVKKYNIRAHIPKPTAVQIIGPDGNALGSDLSEKIQANLAAAQKDARDKGKALRTATNQSSNLADHNQIGQKTLSSVLLEDSSSPLYKDLKDEHERALAKGFARSMHIPLGTEIENISLEYFDSQEAFAGTDAMPEGGFSKLIQCLADDFTSLGGKIHTNEEVKKITRSGSASSLQIVTQLAAQEGREETYQARTAIVTLPLAVLKSKQKALFEPSLEQERQEVIDRISVGNLNKVLLHYAQSWWPRNVGTFFILPSKPATDSVDSSTNLADIVRSTTLIVSSLSAPNGYPADMTSSSLLIMIGGAHGKKLEQFDRLDVANALHDLLYERFIAKEHQSNKEKDSLRHAFYSRWHRQPFTGGATTTPIVCGSSPNDLFTISRPAWDGSLHFSGEHCEVNNRGSIAGAVVSAQKTSENVLRFLNAPKL
jgi:monoamine oxidase